MRLDKPNMPITQKQLKFCDNIAQGMSQMDPTLMRMTRRTWQKTPPMSKPVNWQRTVSSDITSQLTNNPANDSKPSQARVQVF
ncbi:hypothetical protein GCM10009007_00150 [Formosimonas limnophila]|uniref:Uncharacterized protein n=1 Tax=Formosimonas limnophila TaxID=1384487 RepID=A0A8J3CL30_9BURK|nr:hypothetical protein GCM10009007_00150 [Formosimonas limnophila]